MRRAGTEVLWGPYILHVVLWEASPESCERDGVLMTWSECGVDSRTREIAGKTVQGTQGEMSLCSIDLFPGGHPVTEIVNSEKVN